jgi:hypothetical protein
MLSRRGQIQTNDFRAERRVCDRVFLKNKGIMAGDDMVWAIRQQLTGLPGFDRIVQVKENWERILLLIVQIEM